MKSVFEFFYVISRKSQYLRNGTSDQNFKIPKTLQYKLPPQNLGKITSETTFSHSKVVFRPLLRIKRAFSQNPPMARFCHFRGSFPPPKRTKKSKSWPWYIFFVWTTFSSHVSSEEGGVVGPLAWQRGVFSSSFFFLFFLSLGTFSFSPTLQ